MASISGSEYNFRLRIYLTRVASLFPSILRARITFDDESDSLRVDPVDGTQSPSPPILNRPRIIRPDVTHSPTGRSPPLRQGASYLHTSDRITGDGYQHNRDLRYKVSPKFNYNNRRNQTPYRDRASYHGKRRGNLSPSVNSSQNGKGPEDQNNTRELSASLANWFPSEARSRTPAQDRLQRMKQSLASSTTPNTQNRWQKSPYQSQNSHSGPQRNSTPNSHYMLQSQSVSQSSLSLQTSLSGSQNSLLSSSSSQESVFIHPSGGNCGREFPRSNSTSSMSVESGASPASESCAGPNDNAIRGMEGAQESMEWETMPTAVIVKKVAEVRQAVTPSKEGIQVPPSQSLELRGTEPLDDSSPILILVLDTNVFLSAMEFVSRVRDHFTAEFGYPLLFVPWQVVQELDHIKDKCAGDRTLKLRVSQAIRFIESNLRNKHPRILFQDRETMARSEEVLPHECPDDRILAGCLQLSQLLAKKAAYIILVSEDVNLRNKATISKVRAHTVSVMEDVIFRRKPVPGNERGMSEAEKKVEREIDHLFCRVKSTLFEVMSQILIDVMIKKMEPLNWERGVFMKPPWNWKKLFINYSHHWASFVDVVAGFDMNKRLSGLKEIILNHEENSKVTGETLGTFLRDILSFSRTITHPARSELEAELDRAQRSLKTLDQPTTPGISKTSPASTPSTRTVKSIKTERTVLPTGLPPTTMVKQELQSHKVPARIGGVVSESPISRSSSSSCDSGNPCTSSCDTRTLVEKQVGQPDQLCEVRTKRVSCDNAPKPSTPVNTGDRGASGTTCDITPVNSGAQGASSTTCDIAPSNSDKEVLGKVFWKFDTLYRMLETFRLSLYKFLKIDPGVDESQVVDITQTDIQAHFTAFMSRICMLKQCLEKIFADHPEPATILPTNIYLKQLLFILNQRDPDPITLSELLTSLQDSKFYGELSVGLAQFVELSTHYELLTPMVKHFL
ncbi:uncharacterized protein LOC103515746 [Diaphorina citri]|uniref:Uncharacterized protein LOC103515746 n=1 Tax=Diaphorina citri TaxID=121845 RepID=A0A1S3DC24_DIACI|nr:uncharacterized protein LOC103515746 [Diaphorina citri]